jgi:mutator protein MutT
VGKAFRFVPMFSPVFTSAHPSVKPIVVVAALIQKGDTILLCQRPDEGSNPMRWEFPGGKVEPGESHAQGLERELREELGIHSVVGTLIASVLAPAGAKMIHIHLYHVFLAEGVQPRTLYHLEHRYCTWEQGLLLERTTGTQGLWHLAKAHLDRLPPKNVPWRPDRILV